MTHVDCCLLQIRPLRRRARTFQSGLLFLTLGLWLCLMVGCSRQSNSPERIPTPVAPISAASDAISIPGDAQWVNTGVHIKTGEAVTVTAWGNILVPQNTSWGNGHAIEIDPAGTYDFSDEIADCPFPLPSGNQGPAPCFGLIGRIDDGPIFFVGRQKSWAAQRSGTLHLGINDFNVSNNQGQFLAQISKPGSVQPIGFEQIVTEHSATGAPVPGCSVVVFYVDGLRPDVVQEMAALGHIPHIKRLFIDGGIWNSNCFTAFPSDTITSNGTMWTGCFSDRHGIKGQVRFSRWRLESESYLDPLGPNRSARLLAPQGVDKFLQHTQSLSISLTQGSEEGQRWLNAQTSGVPPIYAHLRSQNRDWATGALPVMTEVPPPLWMRSMARHLPYLQAHKAWQYMDDANAHYAVRHLLGRRQPVTIIWLPETDSCSHKCCRGQFGNTRRTIAHADMLIGDVLAELKLQERLHNTYFMLVSDHGHLGGRSGHLSHFDLANRIFYEPRRVTSDGEWIGGGLGMSVRQHRFRNQHQGDGPRAFVFIDGFSDGAARIFLPRGHYQSGDWSGPNSPANLLAYRIAEHLPPVNLAQSLVDAVATHGNGTVQRPIDLVLMKIAENSILITTADRGQAVIVRHRDESGLWHYRYTPVTHVTPTTDGGVIFEAVPSPQADPLGILEVVSIDFLREFHDERTWLQITARTKYPDSVVALTRHMLWQENIQDREREYAPDLVVTAHDGWYFGQVSSPGTMHGYPLDSSMRATWFIAGPNIRCGARNVEPCRLVDLTPTILEMVGIPVGAACVDGRALRTIYKSHDEDLAINTRPVYWQDIDLRAWHPLSYQPIEAYYHLPFAVDRPSQPFDLNNLVYNLISIGDWSILRLFDDVISPLTGGQPHLTKFVEGVDQRSRNADHPWIAEAVMTLNIPGTALGDYKLTSQGNLRRAEGAVDWVQQRCRELDHMLAAPIGRSELPGSRQAHWIVDTTQSGFWEVYRFVQRVVIEAVDETIISGFEDATANFVNSFRQIPAEIVVPDSEVVERPRQAVHADPHEIVRQPESTEMAPTQVR